MPPPGAPPVPSAVQSAMVVSSQLPEALHTSAVQELASLQSAADVHGEQLAAACVPQTPAVQVLVVQRSPSLQSAAVVQGRTQPGIGEYVQMPLEHASAVQVLSPREQSTSVVQATQLGLGSCEQTPPEQVSKVQALSSVGQSVSVLQDTQPPSVALA